MRKRSRWKHSTACVVQARGLVFLVSYPPPVRENVFGMGGVAHLRHYYHFGQVSQLAVQNGTQRLGWPQLLPSQSQAFVQ